MFAPRTHKPATSGDVARLAGVSRATVSFVLNDKQGARISEDTRRRVQLAAEELNYTPNNSARQLRRNGGVEGLLIPAPVLGFGGAMDAAFALIARHSADAGLPTIVHADHDIAGVEGARVWASYRPEAVLVETLRCDAPATEVLRRAGVRALLLMGSHPVPHAPCLVIDQRLYGQRAVESLAAKGHHRLAWLHPADSSIAEFALQRRAGAQEAAARLGLSLNLVSMDADPRSLKDWARGWRDANDRPTAAIAYDDRFAYTAIRALFDTGLSVPRDIAVLGADDYATSSVFLPSVTTIAFNAEDMADLILGTITRMIVGETPPLVSAPPLKVIQRESA
ncbi:MAG TPA: LacI family DNA-binding transcriptional regulator [Streptosporangiaceae bacterium]|jgi:DNA-binding LacI/PurR family transcriptional regulator